MNRSEYIEILARHLKGIDESSLRDIILEIEDHIDGLEREHPEKSPEEIIQTLESPESLADSLREAAGLGPYEEHQEERSKAQQERRENHKKVRITIDDEELHEAIKKAFDIAKIFSHRRREQGDEPCGSIFTEDFDIKNIRLSDVQRIRMHVRSSNVTVLFSNEYCSIDSPGEDTPHIRMEYSSEGILNISVPLGVSEPDHIELRVPATVDELAIATMSGDVHILDRVGLLSITTASGDIRVDACDGDLQAKSASGDIGLSECRGDLKVSTASGDIDIHVDEMCNSIDASSASGDILLRYPEEWDATVSVSTVSGEVEYDGEWSGRGSIRIGNGLAPVRVATVSGDISVKKE